jgi:rubrerythrin
MSVFDREDREKEEVVTLLEEQLAAEAELINLFDETKNAVQSLFVRNLLHMMQLDSMKHLELCKSAISIIRGEDVYKPERDDMRAGLQRHLQLEGESVKRANQILQYEWLRETEGLKALIEILRNDERKHHKALQDMAKKRFLQHGRRLPGHRVARRTLSTPETLPRKTQPVNLSRPEY